MLGFRHFGSFLLIALLTAKAQERDPSSGFRKILEADWEYGLQQHPERASARGDRRFNNRWTDLSAAAIKARSAWNTSLGNKLVTL
jgi:hypothetical protein